MEMYQVRYFLAVARTLNFTRAAEQCNVAQPSLTRAIQKLEDELGGLLVHRERANTHLTELGRLMLPHLERTFLAAQAAKDLARGIRSGESAPLRVGVGSTVAPAAIVDLLAGLRSCVQGVELTLKLGPESEIVEQALAGAFDIVFVAEAQDLPDRVRSWVLFREHCDVIVPAGHRLANQPVIDIAELHGEEMIDHVGAPDRALLHAASAGIAPQFRHAVLGFDELQGLVRAGFGIGFLPHHLSTMEGVVRKPIGNAALERSVIVAVVAGRPFNRATEACLRLARARAWNEAAS